MSALRWIAIFVVIIAPVSTRGEELPPGACAQYGSHRFYHGPRLRPPVISADGRRIASIAVYPNFGNSGISEAKSVAYGGTIVLWNAATGERIREFHVPKCIIGNIAISPDGKWLAAHHDSTITIFDADGEQPTRHLPDHKLEAPHFSADGKRLFGAEQWNRGGVITLDINSGRVLQECEPPVRRSEWLKDLESVIEIVISPDERLVAWKVDAGWDSSVVPCNLMFESSRYPRATILLVEDMRSKKMLYRKEWGEDALSKLVFSPDGRRLFTGGVGVTAYEAATGKEEFKLNVNDCIQIAPSPDGKRAVIGSDSSQITMWNLETKKPLFKFAPAFCHMGNTTWTFSGNGMTLLESTNSTLLIFNAMTGDERAVVGHRYPLTPRFSEDGRTLFTSCDEADCSWDLSKNADKALIARHLKKPWETQARGYSDDHRFVLERQAGICRVFETDTGRIVSTVERADCFRPGFLSLDGKKVLLWQRTDAAGGREVCLYDAMTGKRIVEFTANDVAGSCPTLSPNGRFVAWTNAAHGVTLYDATTGKIAAKIQSTKPVATWDCDTATVLFSHDSEYLIVTTYNRRDYSSVENREVSATRVFQVATGKEVSRFYVNPAKTNHGHEIACAACSKDKRVFAVAEEGSGLIRIFDLKAGKLLAELNGHRDGVQAMAFSPDDAKLASGGADNVAYVWDLAAIRAKLTHK